MPDTFRTRVSASLIVLVVIVSGLNAALLVSNEPPPESISKTQYQSLIYSVSAAVFYDQFGIHLVDGLKPGPPVRFEDLAVDDVGYTIGLSFASKLGLVRFSDETRAFVSQPWSLDGSREFMYGTIRHEIHFLNRLLFALLAAALALGFAIVSYRRTDDRGHGWTDTVALGLSFLLLSVVAPHFLPRLFVWRLHGHGVVASLAVLGVSAALLVRAAIIGSRESRFPVSMARLIPGTFAAGFIIGLIATVRRSEGMIWLLIAVSAAALLYLRLLKVPQERRRLSVSAALFLVVISVGFFVPRLGVSYLIGEREAKLPNLTGELQDAYHPVYHSMLIGISRSSRNSLGIASEADVVELVQSRTGIRGDAFSYEYDAASSSVYWSYVRGDPWNYFSVVLDNIDESIDYVMANFGIRVESFSRLAVALTILFSLFVIVWTAWKRRGIMRFISFILVAYLVLGFMTVLVTTSPASYGPATALTLLYSLGVALVFANTLPNIRLATAGSQESTRRTEPMAG